MRFEVDPDVRAVTEFMQGRIPAGRLVGVAAGIGAISSLLWGHYEPEHIRPLRLSADDLQIQPIARESGLATQCADDGSAVAKFCP